MSKASYQLFCEIEGGRIKRNSRYKSEDQLKGILYNKWCDMISREKQIWDDKIDSIKEIEEQIDLVKKKTSSNLLQFDDNVDQGMKDYYYYSTKNERVKMEKEIDKEVELLNAKINTVKFS